MDVMHVIMCIHKCGELRIVGITTQYRQDRSVKLTIFPQKINISRWCLLFFISPKPDLKNRTKQN